jgi:hypothetical protein
LIASFSRSSNSKSSFSAALSVDEGRKRVILTAPQSLQPENWLNAMEEIGFLPR